MASSFLTLHRTWTQNVFVILHGERVAFLFDRLMLDSILIEWWLTVNKWPFRALICLRSLISMLQGGWRALLCSHSTCDSHALVCVVLVGLFDGLITRAELKWSGSLSCAAIACTRLTKYVLVTDRLLLKLQGAHCRVLCAHLLRREMSLWFSIIFYRVQKTLLIW